MRGDNTLLYIVLAIVIVHFIIGVGFLVYKLTGPVKNLMILRRIKMTNENNSKYNILYFSSIIHFGVHNGIGFDVQSVYVSDCRRKG